MKMRIGTALTLAAALTIVPALLAGHYLNRWGTTAELDAAAERLVKFPNEFGPWKVAREGEPLTKYVQEELGIVSYVTRQYVNRDNGAVVNLLLMVGQPGPLLRHPPNICYANRANREVGMTTFDVDSTTPSSKFTVIEYEPPTLVASDRFLVVYSMSTGEEWSVPRFPRLEFGAAPKLYKVQMLSLLDLPQDLEQGRTALQKFAADFCTAFRTSVVAGTEKSLPASKPTDTRPAS